MRAATASRLRTGSNTRPSKLEIHGAGLAEVYSQTESPQSYYTLIRFECFGFRAHRPLGDRREKDMPLHNNDIITAHGKWQNVGHKPAKW